MTATGKEWVYLLELIKHLLGKDADVTLRSAEEPLDVDLEAQGAASHQGADIILDVASHQDVARALRDATALGADTCLQLNLDPDVEAPVLAADTVADVVPVLDTVAEVPEMPVLSVTP